MIADIIEVLRDALVAVIYVVQEVQTRGNRAFLDRVAAHGALCPWAAVKFRQRTRINMVPVTAWRATNMMVNDDLRLEIKNSRSFRATPFTRSLFLLA